MDKQPTEMTDDEVFGMFRAAGEGSSDRNLYGAEVLRRQFMLSRHAVKAAEASARAANRSSIAALITVIVALLGLVARLLFNAP
jgi:hypothetical protein